MVLYTHSIKNSMQFKNSQFQDGSNYTVVLKELLALLAITSTQIRSLKIFQNLVTEP